MNEGLDLQTQDGSLLCGGWSSTHYQSCSEWNSDSGTWNWQSYALPRIRRYSQSWTPQSGVGTYLIGDEYNNKNTTDLVKPDGTVQEGFHLKYDTRLNAAYLSNISFNPFFKVGHAQFLFLNGMKSS